MTDKEGGRKPGDYSPVVDRDGSFNNWDRLRRIWGVWFRDERPAEEEK